MLDQSDLEHLVERIITFCVLMCSEVSVEELDSWDMASMICLHDASSPTSTVKNIKLDYQYVYCIFVILYKYHITEHKHLQSDSHDSLICECVYHYILSSWLSIYNIHVMIHYKIDSLNSSWLDLLIFPLRLLRRFQSLQELPGQNPSGLKSRRGTFNPGSTLGTNIWYSDHQWILG